MTTSEVATRLVELCRTGDYPGAQAELYADDARSIEPAWCPDNVQQGREALQGKLQQWMDTFETHSNEIGDPIVAGSFFSVAMSVDVTEKQSGNRMSMCEIAVYEVKDGKIVSEQFFFDPPPGAEG
jgi:ketosteroid isomerase-like protein